MTIAQEYGLVKKKSTVAQEYGLAKPTSVSAQLGMGIEESIIGKGLGLVGIEDEIPKVEPQTIPQKVARGIGALGPDLPLYIFGGGIPGAIVKKTVSPIISSASAFALPGVTRETLKQIEEGEGISPTKIATEGAKEAALGATIGAISKIPIKGIKGQAVKFPLETGAFAEAQALEQGRVVPTPEEAIVAGLFLGSLKGFNTALSYGAKKLNVPEKELQKQVKEKAQKENKTQQEALADISGLQKEWDAFVKKANEDLDADLAKTEGARTEIARQGVPVGEEPIYARQGQPIIGKEVETTRKIPTATELEQRYKGPLSSYGAGVGRKRPIDNEWIRKRITEAESNLGRPLNRFEEERFINVLERFNRYPEPDTVPPQEVANRLMDLYRKEAISGEELETTTGGPSLISGQTLYEKGAWPSPADIKYFFPQVKLPPEFGGTRPKPIPEKGAKRGEPQIPQEAQKEVIKPLPSAPAEPIAPPVPIPGIKSAGAGKGVLEGEVARQSQPTVRLYRGDVVGEAAGERPNIARIQDMFAATGQTKEDLINLQKSHIKELARERKALEKRFENKELSLGEFNSRKENLEYGIRRKQQIISQFKKEKAFPKAIAEISKAFPVTYYTESPATASKYATQYERLDDILTGGKPEGYSPKVSWVDVQPKKTLDITDVPVLRERDFHALMGRMGIKDSKILDKLWNGSVTQVRTSDFGYTDIVLPYKLFRAQNLPITMKALKAQGYDSVKYIEGDSTNWIILNKDIILAPSAPPAPPLETTLKAAKPPVVPEATLTKTRGVEGAKLSRDILQEQIAKAQERAEAGITAESLAEKYPEAAIKIKPAKEGYTGQAEYDKATYTVSGKTEAEVLEKLDKRLASVVPYEEPLPTRKREPEATAMTPEEIENIAAPEERLSGGKPGEFKPEQADAQREMEVAFKKAQDALQHGDKPNHQKAMQEIKNLADKMDEEKYARLQEPKRVISDREVAARAAGMPVEKAEAIIAKGAQGETTTAAEVLKQRAEINTAELHNSLPKDKPITEADIPDLMAKTTKTIESLQAAEAGPSEAGRTLRKADLQRKLRESLETLKRRAEREPKRAAEFFDLWAKTDSTNPEAVERFLLSVTEPKFFDYIYEFWYSSILSGPPTQLANVNSTGLWTGWQIPHRFIRAAAEYPIAAIQGRPRQYSFQEAFILWNGYKSGIKEGWAKSWNIFMNGTLEDDMTKWGVEMGKSVEAFNRSPYKPLRWAGKLISIPGRALRAEDTFFKAIAWHGEIAVKAHEKAWADATKLGLKGQAWNDKVGEMVEFYTRKPTPDMLEKAKTFAQYSTFNDAPGGPTNAVLSLRNAVPGSRFLIPFVNTISNLLQRGLEITPGIGLALEKGRALGPEAADVAAKQMTGIAAVTALWLATKYIDGEMTGALPQNTAEREAFYRQGKLPWAFGFNDPRTGKRTYISYRRIEPFNTLFASIASWGDAFRDKEETPTAEKVTSLVLRLGRNLLDGSYLSQFNQAIIAINMGDRGIESTEKIVQRLATSFIPFSSALRSGTKALEAAEEGEVVLRKPETLGEAARENVPFVKKTALPKRDVTGRGITIPGGPIRQFLPYKLSVKQEDVVEDELARLKIFPSMPSRRIGGEELPDKEYAKYVELQGGIWRPQLYQIMSRPGWKRMPEFTQRALIKQVVNQAREIARVQVRPNYRLEALQKQILGSPVESIE